ncbi:MAG TPA: ABC transporter permease [Cyclobacteriaceae bacterium]|nr:ABC transporter permease [Cyclobacteriaceae bacterium]
MFNNFLKVAVRALFRHKMLTLVKLSSLVIGLVCFSIIAIYVNHEMSFDRFHENHEMIYRVVKDFVNDNGSRIPDATTPPAFAPAIARELPETGSVTRLFPGWGRKYLVQYNDEKYFEEKLMRVDSSFFDVFTFPFAIGNERSALGSVNFIVLTESAAKKYFGNDDPVGKTLKIDIGPEGTEFTVTAVLKDIPDNSHFDFQFLIPVRSFNYDQLDTDWGWYNFYTYVRLNPGTDPTLFAGKLQSLFLKHNEQSKNECYIQELADIHLKSYLKWELAANGDYDYVRILFVIAIFILVLSAINYINLVTAQSASRAREVGVRKVTGALRISLVRQFLIESIFLSLIATVIAIILAGSLLPAFNNIFNSGLSILDPRNRMILAGLFGAGLLTGFIAGIYPAFYISGFHPIKALKSGFTGHTGDVSLRKGLVTFQFVISTSLVLGIFIISAQVKFIRNKKLGFSKENIMLVENAGGLNNLESTLNEFRGISGVENAGGADGVIGGQNWTTSVQAEGSENSLLLNFLCTDYNFLEVMKVNFTVGRNFSPSNGADSLAVIINETAAKQLGLNEPMIGSRITEGGDSPVFYTVVGIIEDFHFTSFRDPIKPFGFFLYQPRISTLYLSIGGQNLVSVINQIRESWGKMVPERPFEFSFMDDRVGILYSDEVRFQALFASFTGVTIFLACLGLFGLSAYMARMRTKEIGIRKVLGAGVIQLANLLSLDYIKLAALGIAVSVPVSWLIMSRWLSNFAYHIEMNFWMYVSAASATLAIALLTVSLESIKAALTNPVDSLRSE